VPKPIIVEELWFHSLIRLHGVGSTCETAVMEKAEAVKEYGGVDV
jgi:hypothetical protein